MKTKDLIEKLKKLGEDYQDKEIYVLTPRGILMEPAIKFKLRKENEYSLDLSPENTQSIFLGWQ